MDGFGPGTMTGGIPVAGLKATRLTMGMSA